MVQKRRRRAFPIWGWIVASAIAAALGLGSWGYALYFRAHEPHRTGFDVFYRTCQLFFLNFESLPRPLPWQLEAGRFLAVFVATSAVVGVLVRIFRARVESFWLGRYREHVIVCGLGPKGVALVEALRQQGQPVVVIEPGEWHEGVEHCKELGAGVLLGASTDDWLLRRARVDRARLLLALFQDDRTNLETALLAYELCQSREQGALRCVLEVSNPEFRDLLRRHPMLAKPSYRFELTFFDLYDVGAQVMLNADLSLVLSRRLQALLIIGLGRLGEALLLRAARNWHFLRPDTRRLDIYVVDRDAHTRLARLKALHPLLDETCEFHAWERDARDLDFRAGPFPLEHGRLPHFDAAYVCLADVSLSVFAALRLQDWLADTRTPIIARMAEYSGLAALLQTESGSQESRVRAVGFEDLACRVALTRATQEILAQSLHEQYLRDRLAKGAAPRSTPVLVPWHELREDLKDSNRQAAAHIPAKLVAIGCDLKPAAATAEPFAFSDPEVEHLARMEHERFLDERLRAGWRYGPNADYENRINPNLVPYDDLPEDAKDYNRNAVRILPGALGSVGFMIVRVM
jgi:hypothetical protein